jgi:hypothetical protein
MKLNPLDPPLQDTFVCAAVAVTDSCWLCDSKVSSCRTTVCISNSNSIYFQQLKPLAVAAVPPVGAQE